jgi:hypothetical protein
MKKKEKKSTGKGVNKQTGNKTNKQIKKFRVQE